MQTLKNEIKKAIIDAATGEFFSNGYSKTSLRNISAAAGITAGNLYHYFRGKSELFEAVVSPAYHELVKFRIEHEAAHGDLSTENIPTILDTQILLFSNLISRYRKEVYILFRGSEGTSFEPKIKNYIQKITDHAALHLKESSLTNLNKGDTGILARAMISSYFEGWLYIVKHSKNENEITRLTRHYLEIYLTGPLSMIEKNLR